MTQPLALVLIYDIRGFTRASKRLGTQDLGVFATAAHRVVTDCLVQHRPSFLKNLGDGYLLLWEARDAATEELVAGVVASAVEAVKAYQAYAAQQRKSGLDIPTRIGVGIAFGEVSRSDDYYGLALNLASRLQHLARPEGLALDEGVYRIARARDPALVEGARRLKVRLKGIGRTVAWVRRPFSLARLLGRVAAVLALVLVPLLYAVAADGRLPVPGGRAVRDLIDRYDLSLLRPARSEAEIRAFAPGLRKSLATTLLSARRDDALVRVSLAEDSVAEVWSTSQAYAALCRTPDLVDGHLGAVAPGLRRAFDPDLFVERDGRPYGWLAHEDLDFTMAEPALWTVTALAAALGREGFVAPEEREAMVALLTRGQRAAELYHPLGSGGWNPYPAQVDLKRHSPYTSTLALMALLETRAAGLPWAGSDARRDELLLRTGGWLSGQFEAKGDPPGWRGTTIVSDPVSLGLTFQVYATLLRAELEAGLELPAPVVAALPRLLDSLEGADLDKPSNASEYAVRFVSHEGETVSRTEAINFLWHPWAVEAAARWLARLGRLGGAPEDRVRARRVLGHLVVDLGPEAVRRAREGWTFVASETLYGLSAVPVPE